MKAEFLKLAGVKNEKEFYKKFPDEKSFFKAYSEAKKMIKKAQVGNTIPLQAINTAQNFSLDNMLKNQMKSGGVNNAMFINMVNVPDLLKMEQQPIEQYGPRPAVNSIMGNLKAAGVVNNFNVPTGMPNIPQEPETTGFDFSKLAPIAGDVLGGIMSLDAQKDALDQARQMNRLTSVQALASESQDVDYYNQLADDQKRKRQALMPVVTGEELFPVDGVGTNVLRNGGEITNTYAPGTLYDDLETYEEGGKIKKAFFGDFLTSGGGDFLGKGVQGLANNSAGSRIGGAVGKGLGMIGGPIGSAIGNVLGSTVGALLDPTQQKIKKEQASTQRNVNRMMAANQRNINQAMNQSFMEDGGEIPLLEQGGELQTYWGGYAEPISQNPFLPDGGETVMFRGQSHEESDGQGNTGIGITFGDSPVEVERGEPAVKLRNGGGEDNLVVYGNLQISKNMANLLGDNKASGKKFKNYIADLSKTENKLNKKLQDNTISLGELGENEASDEFSNISELTLKLNDGGYKSQLKSIAEKKINAAELQQAINDTADEYSLDADSLAKGKLVKDKKAMKLKEAMFGTNIPKAQDGGNKIKGRGEKWDYTQAGNTGKDIWDDSVKYDTEWTPAVQSSLGDKDRAKKMIQYIESLPGEQGQKVKNKLNKFSTEEEKVNFLLTEGTNRKVGPIHHVIDAAMEFTKPGITATLIEEQKEGEQKVKPIYDVRPGKRNALLDIVGQAMPFLRPTDAEALDPNQLMGETFALANNQIPGVQARFYRPELDVPYDISFQDQLNEITASERAAQRMSGYNPAMQAAVAGQAYGAKSKVLADQFRANQAMKDQVYTRNRATLNDAQLKNLGIMDNQYTRQQQALSNTKATAQEALNSIASKYAQNKLENRTLQVYENMYNYRFDPAFRAINMNAPQQFNAPIVYAPDGTPNYTLTNDANGNPQFIPINQPSLRTPGINPSTKENAKRGTKIKKALNNGSIVKMLK